MTDYDKIKFFKDSYLDNTVRYSRITSIVRALCTMTNITRLDIHSNEWELRSEDIKHGYAWKADKGANNFGCALWHVDLLNDIYNMKLNGAASRLSEISSYFRHMKRELDNREDIQIYSNFSWRMSTVFNKKEYNDIMEVYTDAFCKTKLVQTHKLSMHVSGDYIICNLTSYHPIKVESFINELT